MPKPEYRVETFRSTEEFQEFLAKLDADWRLHSFVNGSVYNIIAVFWTPVLPVIVQGTGA